MISPILSFWISFVIFIILGIGLLVDIVLVTLYWEKLPRIFKKKLAPVPWLMMDVFKICTRLVLIYLTINLGAYLILRFNPAIKERLKPILNIICSISMYGLSIWFILHFLKINYKSALGEIGVKWQKWLSRSFRGVLFYFGFIPILMLLTYIGLVFCNIFAIKPEPHPLVDILKKEKSILFIYYLIFTAVFIAPVFEEILFRGLFYQVLKKQLGFFRAAIISSGLFSLLHFNTAQFLPVLGLGTLLCFIFEYTGSLIPAIVLHIFNNGLFLGLFFLLKEYL